MNNKSNTGFEVDGEKGIVRNKEEYISWLEKEIEKEDVRVNNGESKTRIRRWALSIMKNEILSKFDIGSDEQNS